MDKVVETIFITGANRGLGLAFSKLYAKAGWKVLSCCRKPEKANELQDLAAQNK
ncbi:SDR family NAD(P)-dependent oxidoreductase, partial [Acinetobacter baumannii]